MLEKDRGEFAALLQATMELYGRQLTPTAISVWWAALDQYPFEQVKALLSQHVTVSKFPPLPADVIQAIAQSDGRPGTDQAWSMCPASEYDTVVWTEETSDAFFAGANDLLASGDKIAARMAFREAYEPLVANARLQRRPMKWVVSLGWDQAKRQPPLQDALIKGRLTAKQIIALLPYRDGVPQWLAEMAPELLVSPADVADNRDVQKLIGDLAKKFTNGNGS